MAALTRTQVIAAYQNAFNKPPSNTFLSYWIGKQDTVLRDKLRADPKAGGVYTSFPKTGSVAAAPTAAAPTAGSQLTGVYKDVFDQSKALLDRLAANGKTVNPNIEITPEQTAAFMHQA